MGETASTPSASRSDSYCLCPPIAQIQEIVAYSAVGELGDRGQDTLEMVAADALHHRTHKSISKSRLDAIFRRVALIHQEMQELVHFGVGETQLALVGLAFPQVCGWGFLENLFWDAHG